MYPVKFKTSCFLFFTAFTLSMLSAQSIHAQINEMEGFYYLVIFETPAPVKVRAKLSADVRVHFRASGGNYMEWWLMESTSVESAEKAIQSIYKSFRIPVKLEAHRVRVSSQPNWSEGLQLSALRYKMLDYGIKMIDPTDNGYALIEALEDENVKGIWMLTEQFEGFYISDSHHEAAVRKIAASHEKVKDLKLELEVFSLKVEERVQMQMK